MATNAARYRIVSGPIIKLLEFGLRRAQGPDGGLSASKYAYIGKKNIIDKIVLVLLWQPMEMFSFSVKQNW